MLIPYEGGVKTPPFLTGFTDQFPLKIYEKKMGNLTIKELPFPNSLSTSISPR